MDNLPSVEAALASGALQDPSVIAQYGSVLTGREFQVPAARYVWGWSRQLHSRGLTPDVATILEQYRDKLDKAGGVDGIMAVARSLYLPRLAEQYVQQIRERWARQTVRNLGERLIQQVDDAQVPLTEILTELETQALTARPQQRGTGLQADPDAANRWFETLIERAGRTESTTGVPTGWTDLDSLTLGWQAQDIILVAARTSMGKSAFALECMLQARERGYKTAYFSLEMSKQQLFSRWMAAATGIPLAKFRSGRIMPAEMVEVERAWPQLSELRICDERGLTADDICAEMRRAHYREGVDLVIVDYIQEVEEPSRATDNNGSPLGRAARKIRKAAQDCNCAVLMLSQINRAVENRSDKRPTLADLSGSAGLESAADVVLLLYRDEYYNPDSAEKNVLEVNVAKQRNGPTGVVKLLYQRGTQRIGSLARGYGP